MIVFVTLAETAPRMCVVQAKVYEMQKGKEERSRPGRQCTVDLAESVKKGAMRYCTCCELRLRCPREHCDAIVDQPAAHDQVAGRRHDGGDVRHPRRRKHYCLDTSTLSWNFICIGIGCVCQHLTSAKFESNIYICHLVCSHLLETFAISACTK